jgi:mercuric ion binding protein
MTKLITFIVGFSLFAASTAFANEQTVTLAVKNMDCATCPYTVRVSLRAVSGVKNVVVSMENKTAVVTYDDSKTDLKALTAATTNVGYPSAPKS